MTKLFVDGAEGTTGLRIHDYLSARTDIEIIHIDPALRKDQQERARCLNVADIVILCLPDAASMESVAMIEGANNIRTRVLDASTAFRIAPDWAYGLPEMTKGQREKIKNAKRVAGPGCHATGFILLVRPLIERGILTPDAALSCTSLTGYSGGGKKLIAKYDTASNPETLAADPYALELKHKHLPEMKAHTGLATAPIFMPVAARMLQGMLVMVPLHLSQLSGQVTRQHLHDALAQHYAGERCIRLMPLDNTTYLDEGFLDPTACNGSNRVDLFVFGNDTQALLVARLDNLGKGAAGAAIQSLNLMLGVDEFAGLKN